MVIFGRGPNFSKAAFRNQSFAANRAPEGTAYRTRIGSPVKNRAHHFHFAGPGITVLAYVAVKAQRTVFPSLADALLFQKVNGKNGCVSAVSASNRERSTLQIREIRNRPSAD